MIPTKIILHHSATEDGKTFSWSAIKRYHVQTLGWRDIGYHAGVELVDDDYFIMIGRMWNEDGAHTLGQNFNSLGLCFVGNFDTMVPPKKQLITGARLVRYWLGVFNLSIGDIHGHKEYNPKTCPGNLFPMDDFKKMVLEV